MRQLAGSDDLWFAIDTESTPMHILEVGIYDPSTSESGTLSLGDVRQFVRDRLGGLPLRQKLLTVPWRADFPYWIEDEHFDLDRHLHQVDVQPPGDWPAFIATLERIMEEPLDRSRPLWDMYLLTGLKGIEGVPEGCVALARKVHHGQFDGTNIIRLSKRLHSTEPVAEPPARDDWEPERTPSSLELLMKSPWNRARRIWRGAGVLSDTVPRIYSMLNSDDDDERSASDSPDEEKPSIPITRFNGSIGTRERVFDGLVLPLSEVMALRHRVAGATMNDVALTILTGALRSYLQAHDELPEDPIVISAPVSAHEEDEEEGAGNRLSLMFFPLPTDEADPLERLRRVRAATGRSKHATEKVGAGNVADVIDLVPTYLLGPLMEQLVRFGATKYIPQPSSGVSITNVPGPRTPTYFNGARLLRGFGCPFLFDGIGLIIAISSYCDDCLVQFGSTPRMMPDPGFFRECIEAAWQELSDAQ